MKGLLKPSVAICTLFLSGLSHGSIILDVPFEPNGIWSSSDGWRTTQEQATHYANPVNPEGANVSHSNSGEQVYSADISGGAYTLEEGQYTIYFTAGNWSNQEYAEASVTFAGMHQSIATVDNSPTPGSGQWVLTSFTWDVANDSSYLGNLLSFTSDTYIEGNSAIDGVGSYSLKGNGFLVEYIAPSNNFSVANVSSSLGIGALLMTLTGAGGVMRRKKKN
jgi:hypothetical protein